MASNVLSQWLVTAGLQRVVGQRTGARALCPFHPDTSGTLTVYGDRSRWKCWSISCLRSGTLQELAALIGVPLPDYKAFFDEIHPPGSKPVIPRSDIAHLPFAYEYAAKRGLNRQLCEEYDLRYENDYTLLIPVHWNTGEIAGFSRRYLFPGATSRYKNDPDLPRERLLYGMHRLIPQKATHCYLTEGFGDVWRPSRYGLFVVGSMGASFSPSQVDVLVEAGLTSVTIWYDHDLAGFVGALLAYDLLRKRLHVDFAMRYARGWWPKDPGDCDRHAAWRLTTQRIDAATVFDMLLSRFNPSQQVLKQLTRPGKR